MASLPTEVKIAKMTWLALRNNNLAIKLFHRDLESEFKKQQEAGGVVNVKMPIKVQSALGRVAQTQSISQKTTPVKVDYQRHVCWSQNQVDATLNKNPKQFYNEVIEPTAIELSTQLDLDAFKMVLDVPNAIGTAGTTPTTYLSIAQIAGRLTNISVPLNKRKFVINPDYQVSMADAMKDIQGSKKVDDFMNEMSLGNLALFDFYISQNLPRLTVGVPGGTPLINGANQLGSSIAIDGLSATGTYKKGDVITFASCYDVNPVNRITQTYLKQFVVTADFTASGGAGNLSIAPAIVTEGAYKNCSVSPANDDAIVHKTSANCANNIAFVRNAFTLAVVPIEIPDMPGVGYTETKEGISITITKGWDVKKYEMVYRADILYGFKTLDETLACRHLG